MISVIKVELSLKKELNLIVFLGLLLVALAVGNVQVDSPLLFVPRALLGLLFLLFVPGYTIQAALFPRRRDLNAPERLAFSFALSVAVIPPSAFLIDRLPWFTITMPSVIVVEGLVTALLLLVAWYRRRDIPPPERFLVRINFDVRRWWRRQGFLNRVVFVALALAFIAALSAAAVILAIPKAVEQYTEFYVLGAGGLAQDFPRSVAVNQPARVTVGVTNHEGEQATFQIEVRSNERLIGQSPLFHLEDGEGLEQEITFVPDTPGSDTLIEFLLYRDGQAEPHRTLRLWVTVRSQR